MDSKDNCSVIHSKIGKKKDVKNMLPSHVVSPILSGEKTGPMDPQLEPQITTELLTNNEGLQVVKQEPSVSSVYTENTEDCLESNIITRKDICGVTPSREISKSYKFQHGVAFTSTPLNEKEFKKGINVFDNLSIINEEEESLLHESKELEVEKGPENLPQTTKECINAEKENESSDLSVFTKDELSQLLDIPNGKILTREKCDVNNLILSVQNDVTVVYKNIFDKTIDDLLLEGNELEKVCNLEIKNDKKEILGKATALKPFVSPNDEENRDNNDPEWELLRKLETDDERYKAVRKLWRNLAIPDLKQNLSTFNWRKKNSLPVLKNIAPIKANEIGKRKKNLMYECTEVFDVGIKKLDDFCGRQYQGIQHESDYETTIMASLNKKPRLDGGSVRVSKWNYQANYDKINDCFQERLHRLIEAKQEMKAVHDFYNGLKNQGNGGYGNTMLISHKERLDLLEIESMISHFNTWYNHP
ncbi:unnamed protein product [Nezara viridula]|uniref:Uncharacterized protein n=1 Tax=Nezara viridula TaxID=85310 RepID=A0A9P0E6H0_NEZVI|nr:unnamed protein product [Nezara viridula]